MKAMFTIQHNGHDLRSMTEHQVRQYAEELRKQGFEDVAAGLLRELNQVKQLMGAA